MLRNGRRHTRRIEKARVIGIDQRREVIARGDFAARRFTDEGGWAYAVEGGSLTVNCTHTDARGVAYSTY